MRDYVEERVKNVANYIAENKSTIREAAKEFHVSKSTVHQDIEIRLPQVNYRLYEKARAVIEVNKEEAHLRGGMATKRVLELLSIKG